MTKAELIKALRDDPSPDDMEVGGYDVDYGFYIIDGIKRTDKQHAMNVFDKHLEQQPFIFLYNNRLI